MRFTLGATIVLMGVLGLLLALGTGEVYRQQALESQRDALKELAGVVIAAQMRELEERAHELGLSFQAHSSFRAALASGERGAIEQEMRKQLHLNFIATNGLKPDRVILYDKHYHVLGSADTGGDGGSARRAPGGCLTLIKLSAQRPPAQQLQPMAALCLIEKQGWDSVLVPIVGSRFSGYLEVISNPTPFLGRIESKLGMPVRIRDPLDRNLYASPTWPPPNAMLNALVAENSLTAISGETALKIAVLRDVAPLQSKLSRTRWLVLSLAILAILAGVFVAIYVFEKTTLQPLNDLAQHVRRVGRSKDHLGETVETGGMFEIRELAQDFNQMTRELDRLYGTLEHLAFTDPLTNLPNRARFNDSLEESVQRYTHAHQPFALFLMDLDRFKAVNDVYGHQVGDLLLQEAGARLRGVLRESDTVTRLANEARVDLESKVLARLGGDEFAAILPRLSSIDDASAVAKKLLLAMQEPFPIRGQSISIGISIGIALYPQHGEKIDALMQRADLAMYFAKNNQCGLAFPDNMQQTELI